MVVRKLLDGSSMVGIQLEMPGKVVNVPAELKDDVYYTPCEDCVRYEISRQVRVSDNQNFEDNWLDALLEVPESAWMAIEFRPDLEKLEKPSDMIGNLDSSFLGKKYVARAFRAMNDIVGCLISISKCVDDPGMVGGVFYSMSFDTLFECMRFVKYFYERNPELSMKYCRVLSDNSSTAEDLSKKDMRGWLTLALRDLKTTHNIFKDNTTLEDDVCFTFMGGALDVEVICGRVVAVVSFGIE